MPTIKSETSKLCDFTIFLKFNYIHINSNIKYTNRKSPPYPANEYCNKKRKGNDGLMYISRPNKNNVCSWKKV